MKKRKARSAVRPAPQTCPCNTGLAYAACCGPLHAGELQAADPSALVRARFSAFALGRVDYLYETLHSAHDDHAVGKDRYVAALGQSIKHVQYRSLRILDTRPADPHGVAQVLFAVTASRLRRDASFIEQADFAEEAGSWRYILGQVEARDNLHHAPEEMKLDH